MRSFFGYYKWHIIFIALFVFCIAAFALNSYKKAEPDLKITCISTEYVNVQMFNDTKGDLEQFLHDADNDGQKYALLTSHTYDSQRDLDELFKAVCTQEGCDLVITTKETFEGFEDKNIFDTSANYVKDTGKYDVLTDETGRVYAVSIEKNQYIQDMGFVNTENLYLAVVIKEADANSLSYNKKNARNIAQVIIKERDI